MLQRLVAEYGEIKIQGRTLYTYSFEVQCVPQKGFGSAVCEQRNREIVHIVSETADSIPFRGTPHRKFKAQNGSLEATF